jgi:HAD superfamily hydrolase (TIGR01459 family)
MRGDVTRVVFQRGIGSLAGTYDAFLIDQWGVLHHGRPAGAGPLGALGSLRLAGKPVAIVTNSGRRAAGNRIRLGELGVSSALFAAVVSSGELAWRAIAERRIAWLRDVGPRCLFFSHDDPGYLDGLALDPTDDPDIADFILAVGVDAAGRAFCDYERILQRAWRRRLRMVCANPDLGTPDGDRLLYGCGAVAARYASWGGEVTYFGKPYPELFRSAIEALGERASRKILVVGDSIVHDVGGARNAGLDCALVLDGIHAQEISDIGGPVESALGALCRRHGLEPDYALRSFRW